MMAILSPADFETLFRIAWTGVVRQRYEEGVLNSERALQACIVGALMNAAPNLVVLVEPTLYPDPKAASEMIPDLWIGQYGSEKALAVVEIKFVPFHLPKWEHDVRKLKDLLRGELRARKIDPSTGQDRDDGKGQIATCNETLGVFAVVGQAGSAAVDTPSIRDGLRGREGLGSRLLHAWGKVTAGEGCIEFGLDRVDTLIFEGGSHT
jgi:hypothetical protein